MGIKIWDWLLRLGIQLLLEIGIGDWELEFGIGDWDFWNQASDYGFGIGIRNFDWGLGIGIGDRGLGIETGDWGLGLKLLYRLKMIFEHEVYLIECRDAGLVRNTIKHNLTLFLNLSFLN